MYTPEFAELLKARAGQKWRPSNGTEGDLFFDAFCSRCVKDANRDCRIYMLTLMYGADQKLYPHEWQYGPDGQPMCSAFETV